MSFIPSIGPKKMLIWRKKKFWFSEFFTPKMGKNVILSASTPGAKRACARCCPIKIFWSVKPHSSINNISKIQDGVFPYFRENWILVISTKTYVSVYVVLQMSLCYVCSLVLWDQASSGWMKGHFSLFRSQIEPVKNNLHTLFCWKSTQNLLILLSKDI